jgi:hypothetical protein
MEFWNYSQANRSYVPDGLTDEIGKIFDRAVVLVAVLTTIVAPLLKNSDNLTSMPEWADTLTETLDFRPAWLGLKRPRLSLVEFSRSLDKQVRTLEKLYKSVAEAKEPEA